MKSVVTVVVGPTPGPFALTRELAAAGTSRVIVNRRIEVVPTETITSVRAMGVHPPRPVLRRIPPSLRVLAERHAATLTSRNRFGRPRIDAPDLGY